MAIPYAIFAILQYCNKNIKYGILILFDIADIVQAVAATSNQWKTVMCNGSTLVVKRSVG